jgi:predicted RNA-binding Zn-ribbon protein involved in translation (DUF1610 family)
MMGRRSPKVDHKVLVACCVCGDTIVPLTAFTFAIPAGVTSWTCPRCGSHLTAQLDSRAQLLLIASPVTTIVG